MTALDQDRLIEIAWMDVTCYTTGKANCQFWYRRHFVKC